MPFGPSASSITGMAQTRMPGFSFFSVLGP
jgi:hypothetical protein